MATEATETGVGEAAERPLLLAAEVGDWPGLGGTVRLELGERRTVLVGKNGAGKSLLVEGLYRGARAAVGLPARTPQSFHCEVHVPGGTPIAYEYGARTSDEETDGPPQRGWNERCWKLAGNEDIWRISGSKLVIGSGTPVPFAPGVGLLVLQDLPLRPPGEREVIRNLPERRGGRIGRCASQE